MKLCIFVCAFLLGFVCRAEDLLVEAARKSGRHWETFPTRTLEQLPESATAKIDKELNQYGGLLASKAKATGFFYPVKVDGRWWLVDPQGCLFLHKGIASVYTPDTPGSEAAFKKKFGNATTWATRTTGLLYDNGFNGLGGWSDAGKLQTVTRPLVYTRILGFMSDYGKKRGGVFRRPGHLGYPNDCIFVFDPEFEAFCDAHARQLTTTKNDPWLLGYFSDNELPLKRTALRNYLTLSPRDHGYKAALQWLQVRYGKNASTKDITEKDEIDFLAYLVDRYFRIVSRAIKKYDPNHLFLGSRFHGTALSLPEIFEAAGPHVDVVSINYYHAWTPDPEKLALWERESGRPILISEWYAKGMDSGLPNTGGVGWTVKSQRDRGFFYQNFVLGLLESKVVVGWHWFKYADDDPTKQVSDPDYAASNKGIVNYRYEPYVELLRAMKQMNERVYSLVEYFDQ